MRHAAQSVQLHQASFVSAIDTLGAEIQAQQLRIRTGLDLGHFALPQLLGGRRRQYGVDHPALVAGDLVALADILRRHTLAVGYHHALVVDVAVRPRHFVRCYLGARGKSLKHQPRNHQVTHYILSDHASPLRRVQTSYWV